MQQLDCSFKRIIGMHCSTSRPFTSDKCDHGLPIEDCAICRVLEVTLECQLVRTLVHVLDRPDVAFSLKAPLFTISLSDSQLCGILNLYTELVSTVSGLTKTYKKVDQNVKRRNQARTTRLMHSKSHQELNHMEQIHDDDDELSPPSPDQLRSTQLEGTLAFDCLEVQLLSEQHEALAECQLEVQELHAYLRKCLVGLR